MDAIYLRQSADKKDSISIETQLEKCLSESKKEYMVFSDKGFSGKNTNRPQFQKMLSMVKNGNVQRIIVYRIDRFSRSIADFSALWQVLSANNVEFVSVNERFDTSTPIGRAMLYIIMSFAQLERETIAERIRDNYFSRLERGVWPGGPPPYGFDIRKTNIDGKNLSILCENEKAENVRKIFDLYANDDSSLGMIGKKMMLSGEKSLTWNSLAVSRIIKCAEYAKCTSDLYFYLLSCGIEIKSPAEAFNGNFGGILCKNTFAVSFHKGVVEDNVWIRCNEKISKNSAIKNTGRGKYSFLSGKLKCGQCSRTVKIINSSDRLYLFCSGRTNGQICRCSIKCGIKEIEEHAVRTVKEQLKECKTDVCCKSVISDEANRKIQRLIDTLCDCPKESAELIKERINELAKQTNVYITPDKINLDIDKLDMEGQKKLFSILIEKVVVQEDTAVFYWNF